jgi:hypothetical protein
VQSARLIVGSNEENNCRNTAFLTSADMCLRNTADIVLPGTHPSVLEHKQKLREFSLIQVKHGILSGALKALIGVHEKKKLRDLGIEEEKLV